MIKARKAKQRLKYIKYFDKEGKAWIYNFISSLHITRSPAVFTAKRKKFRAHFCFDSSDYHMHKVNDNNNKVTLQIL